MRTKNEGIRPTLPYSPIPSLMFVSRSSSHFLASMSLPTWTNCIPTCDSESGEVIAPRDEDVRKIKYLVERKVIFLIELGRVDDGIFGVIGCLMTHDEYQSSHARAGRLSDLQAAPSVTTRKIRFFVLERVGLVFVSFL